MDHIDESLWFTRPAKDAYPEWGAGALESSSYDIEKILFGNTKSGKKNILAMVPLQKQKRFRGKIMTVIAGFGEVMLRLCPEGKKRFAQVIPGELQATFGGGEANVCVSVEMLGGNSHYLTALPDNPVAHAFAAQLRGIGSDVSRILYSKQGRMGVYYAEHGSNMRGSTVVYDREGSTISKLTPDAYSFDEMLDGVTHLHLSGITPSLTKVAFETTLAIAQYAAFLKRSRHLQHQTHSSDGIASASSEFVLVFFRMYPFCIPAYYLLSSKYNISSILFFFKH